MKIKTIILRASVTTFLLFLVFALFNITFKLFQDFENFKKNAAYELKILLENNLPNIEGEIMIADQEILDFLVKDLKRLHQFSELKFSTLPLTCPDFLNIDFFSQSYLCRVVKTSLEDPPYFIYLTRNFDPISIVSNSLNDSLQIFLISALYSLVLPVFIMFRLNQSILRPVAELSENPESNQAPSLAADEIVALHRKIRRYIDESRNALEEKNSYLEKLDQQKDDFLANTTHELKTPLHGIIGMTESLISGAGGPLNQKITSDLNIIVNSGRRLLNLINDILDMSRLKHDDLNLDLKNIGLKEEMSHVLALSQNMIDQAAVKLINSISADLPPIYADGNRVQQIFHNLIGNAIKFTESGEITVSAKVKNEMIEVSVRDTGIGIPADKIDGIFKSFEQADTTITRGYQGTGLGLSITKQLIELHSGTIRIESELGKGSVFFLTFPISKKSEFISFPTLGDISQPVKNDVTTNETDGKFKILVVDDDPVNRQVCANHLNLAGYGIVHAANGQQALKKIDDAKPDLILLDVMMPGISGFEVCQEIRQSFQIEEMPIIFLSAKEEVRDIVRGFDVGGNDYIPKPFYQNEMLARVNAHLSVAEKHKLFLINAGLLPKKITKNTLCIVSDQTELLVFQNYKKSPDRLEYTLGFIEKCYPNQFIRINKFTLVNRCNIRKIEKESVILTKDYIDPTYLKVGKKYLEILESLLNLGSQPLKFHENRGVVW